MVISITIMRTLPTKAILLGLAVAMTPALRAEDAPNPAEAKAASATCVMEATAATATSDPVCCDVADSTEAKPVAVAAQPDPAVAELAALREEQANAKRELEAAQKQLADTCTSEARWKNQAAELDKKLSAGREAHDSLAALRDEMKGTLQEFSAMKQDIASVRSELRAPAERIALRKENEGLKGANAALGDKLKQTETSLAETTAKQQETGKQLADANGEIAKLKSQLATATGEIDNLKQAGNQAAKESEALAARNRDMEGVTANLVQTRDKMEQQLAAADKALAANASATKASEEQLAAARKAAEDSKGAIDALTAKHSAELLQATEQASKAQAAISRNVEALNARLEESQKEASAAKEEAGKANETSANFRKEAGELRDRMGVTADKLKQSQTEAAQARDAAGKVESLTEALKAARDSQSKAESTVKDRDVRIAELQSSIEKQHAQDTAKVEESAQ